RCGRSRRPAAPARRRGWTRPAAGRRRCGAVRRRGWTRSVALGAVVEVSDLQLGGHAATVALEGLDDLLAIGRRHDGPELRLLPTRHLEGAALLVPPARHQAMADR